MAGILLVRALFIDNEKYPVSDPYLTLFGNSNIGFFAYLTPLFVLYGTRLRSLKVLHDTLVVLSIISILYCLYLLFIVRSDYIPTLFKTIPIFIIFFPYIKKYKGIVMMSIIITMYVMFFIDERAMFLMMLLCIISYILVVIVNNRLISRVCSFLFVSIPVGVLVSALLWNISIYEILEDMYLDSYSQFKDSRSFIFFELAEDLTYSDAWIWGKGIFGTHYSSMMQHVKGGDAVFRIGVEVGFLQYLLKGGLVYLILYMVTLIIAIYLGLNRSNNKLVRMIALILSGHFLLSIVSEYPKLDIPNVVFWILIGCCYSPRILKLNDKEIGDFFIKN
jgi:hypothetical protein